jgi:hypothetical protein
MNKVKAYCINLDSRPDKWTEVQEAFAGTDLSLQRFSGIYHKEGWRGCGASHVAIAREALRLGLPWVIVIEDDCIPVPSFTSRWPAIFEALKRDNKWDMFIGGATHVQGPIDVREPLIEIERGFALHFYVLKASAFEKAIAWDADRHGPIDVYYSDQFRAVTTERVLAIQRPSHSDIRQEETDYTEMFDESEDTMNKLLYSVEVRSSVLLFVGCCLLILFLAKR